MRSFLALLLLLSLPMHLAHASSQDGLSKLQKLPYKPQWVSLLKKGRIVKYKRKEFSSPRVGKEMIFVGSDGGYFYALKIKSGKKVWRFKTHGTVNSTPAISESSLESSSESSRIIFGDDDGFLYALSAEDGKELWKQELGSEILSAPTLRGDKVYVASLEGKVSAFNLSDGKMIWQKEAAFENIPQADFPLSIRGNSPPTLDPSGKVLFVGFANGTLLALSASDGHKIWERTFQKEKKSFADIDGAPLAEGETLYIATYDGGLFALSQKSGAPLWSREIGSGVDLRSAGKNLLVSGSNGHLYAINKKDGTTVWETRIGEGALTAPVFYQNLVAVGLSDKTIHFVSLDNGKILARRFARKGVSSDPIIVTDENGKGAKIFYLSNGGRLYSLKLVP